MASDSKKSKAEPAAKTEVAAKSTSGDTEAAAKKTAPDDKVSKSDSSDTAAAAPSNYSRGEGQKPVTRAYKENWNAIFAKKKTKGDRKKR